MTEKKSGAKKSSKKSKVSKKNIVKKSKASPKPKKESKPKVRVISKALGKAPHQFAFVLSDGRRLRSLFELAEALSDMDEKIFNSHVTDMKNDFCNWIRDVFEEPQIAEDMENISNQLEAEVVLLRKILKKLET